MLIVRTVAELRDTLRPARRAEQRIGLVATMGALHEGHLSLLRHARLTCDSVVMSLFVNPRQFNEADDLAAYPRDEKRDATLAAQAGVDVLFAPAPEEVYPPGFATTITVGGPARGLESDHRGAGHFDGMATVVCKLLNMVEPAVAFFGAKDAQQAAVVARMVRDLDMHVAIEVRPTVREADGLAMSSRNLRLTATERRRANALHAALQAVRDAVRDGERDPDAAIAAGHPALAEAAVELEYLTLVDPRTMAPLARLDGAALAVIAARIGEVRLIDNLVVHDVSTTPQETVATATAAPTV